VNFHIRAKKRVIERPCHSMTQAAHTVNVGTFEGSFHFAEAEAKSDERLAVFMKWVESKLVELTDSAKMANRPAEELEEIVHLTGEALRA
jgi:hypothetical protein